MSQQNPQSVSHFRNTAVFHNLTPCNDGIFFDPLLDMQICSMYVSGINGGRFGLTRIGTDTKPKQHNGLDLLSSPGTPVFSCTEGVVAKTYSSYVNKNQYIRDVGVSTGWSNGNCIFVESYINGVLNTFCYLHLTDVYVIVGDIVTPGQIIGTSGTTGNYDSTSGPPHLHLQVKKGDHTSDPKISSINPEDFIYSNLDVRGQPTNKCK